ncbi:MAG TPA: SxtJ family membrane protein [Isosphaeraceae bacterium]|nr:SxtJ family membrane protein [Isosphaeraceae bacterium]
MHWSDIPFDPPRTTLRQFAGLWLVFFGGMALWQGLARGRVGQALVLALIAVTIGPLGMVRPDWMRWVYVGWMILAFPIGWTVSQVMLAVMFFGLFTPIGLLFRLVGRDSLHRARSPERSSYWSPKPAPADLRRYFKQF